MATPKKSRDGHAKKPDKNKPATLEPVTDEPPARFDAKAAAKAHEIWWLKGKDTYLRPDPSGREWVPESGKQIARCLRLKGITTERFGRTYSQLDEVLQHVADHQKVTFAQPLSGKKAGVHYLAEDLPIIVTNSYRMVEGVRGEWPLHRALGEALFVTTEADQTLWSYAWLKIARQSLRSGIWRPGPWMFLSGPPNCGKSFYQGAVYTPMLGGLGRDADPLPWLLGTEKSNADLVGAEHLKVSEMEGKFKHEERSNLAQRMKKVAVERWHRWRGMYNDGFNVPVFWRASLSVNENVDDLKKLPSLGGGFADKAILLSCEKRKLPWATETTDDWLAAEAALARERPAFAHFLDHEFVIPPEMRRTDTAGRYGFDVFHHPRPLALLFSQERESGLLHILDNCDALYTPSAKFPAGVWGPAGAEELKRQLCEDDRFSEFRQLARSMDFPNAFGTFLSRLEELYPNRIEGSRVPGKGNHVWTIIPPPE